MGLLVNGTISVSVMSFYMKCLHNILKSTGRADRYGLMCPLTIQSQCSNEDMSLVRNRIGEGGVGIDGSLPEERLHHLVQLFYEAEKTEEKTYGDDRNCIPASSGPLRTRARILRGVRARNESKKPKMGKIQNPSMGIDGF
ncbi:hypothetical protein CASFOL_034304 [Castilleja foliolosa]|uniref:Uncharacterized protein n=1 Tax=Castilleja foliolosa TaxID=1961234 RepID=A0ABD3BWE9_9LAMI